MKQRPMSRSRSQSIDDDIQEAAEDTAVSIVLTIVLAHTRCYWYFQVPNIQLRGSSLWGHGHQIQLVRCVSMSRILRSD